MTGQLYDDVPDVDQAPPPPTPFLKGLFSMYHTPDGGIHISYRPEGAEEDEHIQIPAPVVMLATQMEAGQRPSMRQMMKMMAGLGG